MALLPSAAWAIAPHARDDVPLTDLQKSTAASLDEAKAGEYEDWEGELTPPDEYNPTKTAPPPGGSAAVALDASGDRLVQAGDLPVSIGKASPTESDPEPPAPTGTWNVAVQPRSSTEDASVDGAIITVTPPSSGATPVDVQLDYGKFEDLYGTEWASRLQLVQLPECFLTAPEQDGCATPTEVPTENDPGTETVRATVDPATAQTEGLTAQSGGGPMVLAATDSASGAGGTYKATDLSPSGTWTAGGSGGGFSWTYPLTIPKPPAGPAPKIALDYSSQAVDGKTSVANGQASWVGDGWSYHPGFIERRYRTCSDDLDGSPNNDNGTDKKKADLCWASDNVVMSLGGTTTDLVHDDASGEWTPSSDGGERVEHKTSSTNGNGDNDGEYWIVTTRDGTRYWFGRNKVDGGLADTNSVFTAPVFGNHAGEPCHKTAFADSACTQAWRWNLDYVEDVHGNAMVVDWARETNHYAKNGKFKQHVSYVRGGYPKQIRYGLRADDLGGSPSAKVTFSVSERCVAEGAVECSDTEFTSKNYEDKQPWWDTPSTLNCTADVKNCYVSAPTFWTRKRLTGVTTYAQRTEGSTALSKVDHWALEQSFPRQRTDTHPPLWLDSITRTGYGTDGSGTSLPPVTFLPNVDDMPNRVARSASDPTPDFDRLRVATIRTETGGEIQVSYSMPCPSGSAPDPKTNGTRCFPVHWSPDPDLKTPKIEWFNKYVVAKVTEKDRVARQPDVVTTYTYEGDGAWAKDTDEFSKPALRTYSQWRGYASVLVKKGVTAGTGGNKATEQSQARLRFFRGMSRDAGRAEVTVKDSKGGSLAEDLLPYQGLTAETIVYTKSGGTVASRQVTVPWAKKTATRKRGDGLPDLDAWRTGVTRTDAARMTSTGHERTVRTVTTVDSTYGLPLTSYRSTLTPDADGKLTTGDRQCTTTTYVHNTAEHLIGLVQRVRTTAGDCDHAPTASADEVVSDARTSYDALNAFGTAPTRGLPYQVDTVQGDGSGWVTTSRATYDALGRVLSVTDAQGHKSTTAYTPATGTAFTTTTTDAAGFTRSTLVDPGRGTPLTVTDANDRRTTATYDDLGRTTAVWTPSHKQGTDKAVHRFAYQIGADEPPAVTSSTLRDNGTYEDSVTIYDGLLRPRQTQSEALGGGRLVTDVFHNASGTVEQTDNEYLAKGEPDTEIFVPESVFQLPASTQTAYDGMGRPVKATELHEGDPDASTVYKYGGDWTLVWSGKTGDGTSTRLGSNAVKTFTDTLGRTRAVRYYTDVGLHEGQNTHYVYDARDTLSKVTDAQGNTWSYEHDARGRLTGATDPDLGTFTFGYDDLDRQIWSQDGAGRRQYTAYDVLGRRTALRDDAADGTLVAKWTYDSVSGGKGQLASSARYYSGEAFVNEVTGYDSEYRVTGTRTTIPDTEATKGLAGSYGYGYGYTDTGKPLYTDLPATPGGLAAERVITRYNGDGVPLTTSGLNWYTSDADYSPYGQVLRTVSGESGHRVWSTNEYDVHTGRLTRSVYDRETAGPHRLDDTWYGYDIAGNVTWITDVRADGSRDRQCFSYDPMGQLRNAWTGATGGCPHASGERGAGPDPKDVTAGPDGDGYWYSYDFDSVGNRTELVDHDLNDPALDDTYTYDYGVTSGNNGTQPSTVTRPHALTRVDSVVHEPGSTATSMATYGYDVTGNTITRTLGGDTQNLEWDRRNKVTSVSGFGTGKGAVVNASGKCLDVEGAKTADGTPVQLYRCNGTPAQQWQFTGDTLRALGKCATASGTNLVLSACDGSAAQTFTRRAADDSLYQAASGKCVAVPSADFTDGRNLQLSDCAAGDAQRWTAGDTTSYLYDAQGDRLVEKTATTRTLYLGETTVTVDSAGTALNAERYYSQPGAPTTLRRTHGKPTGHELSVLLSDRLGTATTAVSLADGQAVTRRKFGPYGNPRGAEPGNWPGRSAFLGTGVTDSTTGLTHIGAREYDPVTGRFLSVDPVIDISDPLQMNGYAYANGNPVTLSDPTGLLWGWVDSVVNAVSDAGKGAWNGAVDGFYDFSEGVYSITDALGWTDGAAQDVRNDRNGNTPFSVHDTIRGEDKDTKAYKFGYIVGYSSVPFVPSPAAPEIGLAEATAKNSGRLSRLFSRIVNKVFHEEQTPRSVEMPVRPPSGNGFSAGRLLDHCNSFLAGTEVLLADGSSKPIEDLRPGDRVRATDPETGYTAGETVTTTFLTKDDKSYVDVKVGTPGDASTIHTTDHHPFWSESEHAWLNAADLKPGMALRTDDGATVTVLGTHAYQAHQDTYNLTVEELHTYYVLAGATPVLVHNSNCGPEFNSPMSAFRHYMKHAFGVQLNKKGNWTGAHGYHQPDMAEFNGPGGFRAYKEAASKFMSGSPRHGDLVSNDGTLFRADHGTGYFGVLDSRGNIQTFFRPGGNLDDYMREQQSKYGGSFVE
ncbi:ricin-type beta-trefoil lectin domain protein [Streptomyces sp. MUM 2J]|uniref:ricin-type beta-trefoil lectin domain protein n=1 Tax=Streptomyces sp. MUM 2J TaxID=2791987 RepID=UPI001F04EC64|nr:ricin-type beta-trefoil lectin domain protein [Streptomyces sp. MUM 2J]MCH0561681.1 ricin-type beta-trefoil lectin domain protein [Streptomyces sp. MUM 2J]